ATGRLALVLPPERRDRAHLGPGLGRRAARAACRARVPAARITCGRLGAVRAGHASAGGAAHLRRQRPRRARARGAGLARAGARAHAGVGRSRRGRAGSAAGCVRGVRRSGQPTDRPARRLPALSGRVAGPAARRPGYVHTMMRAAVPILIALLLAASRAAGQVVPSGFAVEPLAQGLNSPTALQLMPDDRVLFAEQFTGRVRVFVPGFPVQSTPVLQLTDVTTDGGERGLLGVALDPAYPTRPYLYVHYTAGLP